MKILAVDTSARSCSVAIAVRKTVLADLINESGETHSKHLMYMIKRAFEISGLKPSDIDGFAVTKGPGSFTGLRIGISSVKGLAAAAGKPVAGISTLDALAAQVPETSYLVCVMMDARKGEVYSSRYRFVGGIVKRESKEENFIPEKAIEGIKEPCLFTGDGALAYGNIIKDRIGDYAVFLPGAFNIIKASTVAFMGMKKFQDNDIEDAGMFVPFYIRKSDVKEKT
ncbi:MAG: tRNA (adenosine(37)-N6)-threonylcarbamoyltransferase complex dimerization subunit type 1 TsaB [Desulfobacteraceae bacterium]|nr:MAG: tRNA (adenosine(37)-N6)-threonylcarbamoyltransferase complex dimerization subunit type 1 TsaB [Desulfobacteraceae bacterium]